MDQFRNAVEERRRQSDERCSGRAGRHQQPPARNPRLRQRQMRRMLRLRHYANRNADGDSSTIEHRLNRNHACAHGLTNPDNGLGPGGILQSAFNSGFGHGCPRTGNMVRQIELGKVPGILLSALLLEPGRAILVMDACKTC